MSWHRLVLVLIVIAVALTGSGQSAELPAPGQAAQTQAAPQFTPSVQAPPVYADFPAEAYPPGFSSYRGLGFMGFCCEHTCPAVESLWQNYTCPREHHGKLFHGKGQAGAQEAGPKQGLPVTKDATESRTIKPCATTVSAATGCAPAKACAPPKSCAPACGEVSACCGPGANYWPMNSGVPPLGARLHAWKANGRGMLANGIKVEEQGAGSAPVSPQFRRPLTPPEPPRDSSLAPVPVPTPEVDRVPAQPAPPPPPAAAPPSDSANRLRILPPRRSADASLKIPAPSPDDKTA